MLQQAGIVTTDSERAGIEVTDFGLARMRWFCATRSRDETDVFTDPRVRR